MTWTSWLGSIGGESQPIGRYSRFSELTFGIARKGRSGIVVTSNSVGVSARLRVLAFLLLAR